MKRFIYKIFSVCAIASILCNEMCAYAYDEVALIEPVAYEYTGTDNAGQVAVRGQFVDVPSSHWAKDAISRAAALEFIKGYDNYYNPERGVNKAETIALMIRLIGQDMAAEAQKDTITASWPKEVNMKELWAIGHIALARDLGFIEELDYQDALYPRQSDLNSDTNFVMGDITSREELANWASQMLMILDPTITNQISLRDVYNLSDWKSINPDYLKGVEIMLRNQVMEGVGNGIFNPKGDVTRAQMAKIIENIDEILYANMKLTKKTGYVAEIQNDFTSGDGENFIHKSIYVRNVNGKMDKISNYARKDNIGQVTRNEIVVFKNNVMATSKLLEKGDNVEYLVNENNQVVYMCVRTPKDEVLTGSIYSMEDIKNGKITFKLANGNLYTGNLKAQMYNEDDNTLLIMDERYKLNGLPITSNYQITVKADVVTQLNPMGDIVVIPEIRGVVKGIDLNNRTIEIYDGAKNIIKKKWNINVQVEKKEYYETTDEIGYIDEVFKEYMFDKIDSKVDNIEIGDTVYLRLDDNGIIKNIDVGSNYGIKYGKIKKINYYGVEGSEVVVEYENGTIDTLDIDTNVIVKKNNRRLNLSELVVGDWAKILYNRGIVSTDYILDTVKQINISGIEQQITNIYKGELAYVDTYQEELNFVDTEKFSKVGWIEYNNMKNFKISDDIEYYDGNKRVSRDYVNEFMKNYGMAYIAVSETFGQEEIIKLTFRDSREQILEADNINVSKGNGEIKLTYDPESIIADEGTIIRRLGRCVDSNSIFAPDYAKIVLNGRREAAVIDITEEINNDKMAIFRGKIKSVEEKVGFNVQSFSKLQDMVWSYMPLEREFDISNKTKIYAGGSLMSYDKFRDYTVDTQIDKIYTIFAIGDDALILSDMPYTKYGVIGKVYEGENGSYKLKEAVSYNFDDKKWEEISRVDKTIDVGFDQSSVVIKNGEVIQNIDVEIGDKIRVLGTENGYDVKKAGGSYTGYIIFIES